MTKKYEKINLKWTLLILLMFLFQAVNAQQDSTDLIKIMETKASENEKNEIHYTTGTFKTTRLINGHTVENLGKGILDVKISHRFGKINQGSYELFGLDNATMRLGLDYGITRILMAGIGRSTFEKTFDGFIKVKIMSQSTGGKNMPVTLSYIPTIAIKTIKYSNDSTQNNLKSRLFFTHQLLLGRKFNNNLSLQIMPTYTHQNHVINSSDPHDLFAIGTGGRYKLSKRVSLNIEYYFQLPTYRLPGTTNSLSAGFDIETGGHVFQLFFTNSQGMSERTFISETSGRWDKWDIFFGFNISRVFTVGKKK